MPAKKSSKVNQPFEAPKTGLATTAQACKFLNLSRSTIVRMRSRGELKSKTVGRAVRLFWDSLHAFARGEPQMQETAS